MSTSNSRLSVCEVEDFRMFETALSQIFHPQLVLESIQPMLDGDDCQPTKLIKMFGLALVTQLAASRVETEVH